MGENERVESVTTMDEAISDTAITSKGLLEDLVLDSDLDRLKSLTLSFNIFEAIGAVRREMRHSDYLSFLMNPLENHGLLDIFLKRFLIEVTRKHRSVSNISPIDIDLLDLSGIEVRREWENIDIFLLSVDERFICAIENKIDSSEHSNQLAKYNTKIDEEYPGYNKLLIYLTLEGLPPEKDYDWLPFSYEGIYDLVISVSKDYKNSISEEVLVLLSHYGEMINRHFMVDNEIATLSRNIYKRHKKALDLIFEHKPDMFTETRQMISDLLSSCLSSDFVMDHCTKSYIRFTDERWDKIPAQTSGDGQWTKTGRVLLFEVINASEEIAIKLLIGPGDDEFRNSIFSAVEQNSKMFKGRSKTLYPKWTQLYKKRLVSKAQLNKYSLESVENLIKQGFEQFFHNGEFAKICEYVDSHLEIA